MKSLRLLAALLLLGVAPAAAQSRIGRQWPPVGQVATPAQASVLVGMLKLPGLDANASVIQEALGAVVARLPTDFFDQQQPSEQLLKAAYQNAQSAIAAGAGIFAAFAIREAEKGDAATRAEIAQMLNALSALGPDVAAAVAPARRSLAAAEEAQLMATAQELADKLLASGAGKNNPLVSRNPALLSELIEAADQTLNVGLEDTLRGGHMTSWSLTGLDRLISLGLPKDEIERRARQRLEAQLVIGRRRGLVPMSATPYALPPGDPASEGSEFERKHTMSRWKALRETLGVDASYDNEGTGISLPHAYAVAREIGDQTRADEAFFQMLQLGKFDEAARSAENAGDDQGVLTAGMLAAAEFLFNERFPYHANNAWYAIEGLKRVNGPLRAAAAAVLKDLGLFLGTEEFLSLVASDDSERKLYVDKSLRALRSTGRVIKRVPVDSVKVDFWNVVEDPEHARLLKEAARKALGERNDRPDEEVLKALGAAGDVETLRRLATKVLTDPQGEVYWEDAWLAALTTAGEAALLSAFGRRLLDTRAKASRPKSAVFDAAAFFAAAKDKAGLADARKALFSDAYPDLEDSDWDRFDALAGKAAPPAYDPAPLQWELDSGRARLKEALVAHAERPGKRAEGQNYLAKGDFWNAGNAFLSARDVDGLRAAANGLLDRNDGLNAWAFLVAAALLEAPEGDLLN